jgi:hypothetical protein
LSSLALLLELIISKVAIDYGIHQPVNLVKFFDGVFHDVIEMAKVVG